jgi:hypothetical protein
MSALKSRIPGPGTSSSKGGPTAPAPGVQVKSHPTSGDQHRSKAVEWVNQQLRSSGFEPDVEDLIRDMTDGVHLPNLVQCLSK